VAGTINVVTGTSQVQVNVNGAVTVQLPAARGNAAGAGAVPGTWIQQPVRVVDIGGFAAAQPITVLPAGADLIAGLASVQISSAYGSLALIPNVSAGGWSYSI
jgi:hypothetical protein